MKTIVLDGSRMTDPQRLHPYLIRALDLPDYYGSNLDALYECLADMADLEIRITPPEEVTDFFRKVLFLFREAAEESDLVIRIET